MTDFLPTHYEEITSQLPALHLLCQLGYEYILPKQAHELRGKTYRNVILGDILHQFLQKQTFRRLGVTYHFSEYTISQAIEALEDVENVGLVQTNKTVWGILRNGKSFKETYRGGEASFNLNYIDWQHPHKNFFHVTDEFEIERNRSTETCRPDIVCFVNGIPFITLECKRAGIDDPIGQAITQLIRYQQTDEIPQHFHYNQLLLAIAPTLANNNGKNKIENLPKYGTIGTPRKFWGVWREEESQATADNEQIAQLIKTPLSPEQTDRLFTPDKHRFTHFTPDEARQYCQNIVNHGRTVTAQDQLIYALCRPERLLELTDCYSLFDAGERKIARYQQYFTIKNIIDRIAIVRSGRRKGGVVWHTQGSGKSITMVLLAEAIAKRTLDGKARMPDPRIILVTDRTDLDDQIYGTFSNCGVNLSQAKNSKHLRKLLDEPKANIIATLVNKFDAVVNAEDYKNESPNIFVLVDESHRSQFGAFHYAMKRAMPNACYIGFTGTPILKKDKHTVKLFGGMLEPTYTIRKALEDEAIVPLLYESRLVDQDLDKDNLDRWFERYTNDLTETQKAQLQHHFATKKQLNEVDSKIEAIAWDVTGHYCTNFQGRGLKGQLVAPSKAVAIKYKKYLDQIGKVSCEVLISPPGVQEGDDDPFDSKIAEQSFWDSMMERYKSPKQYQESLVNGFKYHDHPEIIIVVDKLLTGFDAPRNTVLYLTRTLKDHRLLQAIARVNRLYEGKEYGVIVDYAGVLKLLGDAINLYDSLEGTYEEGQLEDVINTLSQEWRKLEQVYSHLWELFVTIRNRQDTPAFVELLRDDRTRHQFNERFSEYGRILQLALSSLAFYDETPKEQIQRYKQDFKFFTGIRQEAIKQYGDTLDLKQHQKTIQNLLNQHVKAQDIKILVELIDIFDVEAFQQELNALPSPIAKAETIASRTVRTITEKFEEDEAFYQPFSERLEQILEQIREKRYQDAEALLQEAADICDQVRNRNQRDDIPQALKNRDVAQAYYGIVHNLLKPHHDDPTFSAQIALGIDDIIESHRIINWHKNTDIQNQIKQAIEDLLFEQLGCHSIKLNFDEIDTILDKCVGTAVIRLPDA